MRYWVRLWVVFCCGVVWWPKVVVWPTIGSRGWVTGPTWVMLALVPAPPPVLGAPVLTPAALCEPCTPWPAATEKACEEVLGTPGSAPPACARSTFHSRGTRL